MANFVTNASGAIWWPTLHLVQVVSFGGQICKWYQLMTKFESNVNVPCGCQTLPEAQRTQSIQSITWVNLSTRIVWNWFQWNFLNWLQIWTPDGATSIDYKFGHPLAPIALVPNLTTRCNHLHWLLIWPLDGATRISYKVGHQMAPLALVPNLTTRWRRLH